MSNRNVKYLIFIVLFVCFFNEGHLKAQFKGRQSFVGVGIGWNESGIGVLKEYPFVAHNLSFYGGLGFDYWGFKVTAGASYYLFNYGYGSSISLGYSYTVGKDSHTQYLQINDSTKQNVNLKLLQQNCINLFYSYSYKLKGLSKVVFSAGYSLLLDNKSYVVNSDVELTNRAKRELKLLAPGGIIIGVKYMFGS